MGRESIADLIAKLHNGKLDRREFVTRAGAAGLSIGLIGNVLRASGASAQATPDASGMPESTKIGKPDAAHVTDTSKGTIRLYSSWPLTGSYDQIGGDAVEAIKLGLADFGNAAGGFKLEYEALDDGVAANGGGWEAAKETENVNKVINDPDSVVYMATYNSGAAKISIPIAGSVGLAQISYANTYPGLTKKIDGATEAGEPEIYFPSGKRNYMRVCPADDIQGAAGANWALKEQNRKKVYILHDKSLYGKGVAAVFQIEFKKGGGEVLGFEGYEPLEGNYTTLATKIADKTPDMVFVGATVDNNAAKVFQDLRGAMSIDEVLLLGPDGLVNDKFVQGAADGGEGAWLTFAGYTPDKLLEIGGPGGDYVKRITDKLGHGPDSYAVYAYEMLVVVIQAIDRVGEKDRAKILQSLITTEGFNSLLGGTWSFTETGDTDSAIIGLSKIVNGKIAYQKTISGAA